MREVFISYAHLDNTPNPNVTHEITQVVDHFLAIYNHISEASDDDSLSDMFFVDRSSIKPGDHISQTIRAAIDECSVMLVFVSPRYFKSTHCFEEWRYFRELQDSSSKEQGSKILIPIEVREVRRETISPIADTSIMAKWIDDLIGVTAGKYGCRSDELLALDTAALSRSLRELRDVIQAGILARQGSSYERISASNVLALKNRVLKDSLRTTALNRELQDNADSLKFNKLQPVCVIFAGGTVGMVHRPNSDQEHADFQMAPSAEALVGHLRDRLKTMPFNMHFFSLEHPIDSSNVTSDDWVNLATLIQEQMGNYQGFVILHGTNTLAYTSSALSFLLAHSITKPVVITGAEVPLSVDNTDADFNVDNAIRAAAWQAYNGPIRVPEVTVFWNNHLYRGNRVVKMYASDRVNGFHSPNMRVPLATLSNERLTIENGLIISHANRSDEFEARVAQKVVDLADARVDVMLIHPGLDFESIELRYPTTLDGLILLTYGAGNVPEDPRFISHIRNLVAAGTVVCNVTQCPYGRIELKLFETSATLFDLGVVDAYDMTLEAAFTKLKWVIARRSNRRSANTRADIRKTFQRNIAGEISATIHDLSFGSSNAFELDPSGTFCVSDVNRIDQIVDRSDISAAFIRLEGFSFPKGQRVADIRLSLGRPAGGLDYMSEEVTVGVLADFHKELTTNEEKQKAFDKNLQVSGNFRRWYNNDEFQVSIGVSGIDSFSFSSCRLVVYTGSSRMEASL